MHGHEFSCSLVHLFKFISGPFEKGSGISNEGYSLGIYSFDKVFGLRVLSSSFLVLLRYSF